MDHFTECTLLREAICMRGRDVEWSEQVHEPFLRETGLANKERSVDDRRMAQNNMAAGLMVHFVIELAEGFHRVCTGTDGQTAHTGTSMISSVMPEGIGSPCFL